jgi:hypothetical protein
MHQCDLVLINGSAMAVLVVEHILAGGQLTGLAAAIREVIDTRDDDEAIDRDRLNCLVHAVGADMRGCVGARSTLRICRIRLPKAAT